MANGTEKLFTRTMPETVGWNDLFELVRRADRMSALLDRENSKRKREGRSVLLRTVARHNQRVEHLLALLDGPDFPRFAAANDCTPGDMAIVRYASHPSHLNRPTLRESSEGK